METRVCEAAALGCAWKGVRSRQAGAQSWGVVTVTHKKSKQDSDLKQLFLPVCLCVSCPTNMDTDSPLPIQGSGGPQCWPDHVWRAGLSCVLSGTGRR